MGEPTIEITGKNAEDAARELQDLLRAELGQEARRVAAPAHETGLRADPLTVASLILAIPGFLLATADLAARMKLSEKAVRLIAWAKQRKGTGVRIEIISPDGGSKDLADAEPGEVIETLTRKDQDTQAKR